MEHLVAIQNCQLNPRGHTPAVLAGIEQRRAEVPAPVLAHFERMLARGKKGLAVVRDGVCTECHLRLTTGKLANLTADNDICLCDNCGRYLYLAEPEKATGVATRAAKLPPVKRTTVKTAQPVA